VRWGRFLVADQPVEADVELAADPAVEARALEWTILL
jgi:hypothetical protein